VRGAYYEYAAICFAAVEHDRRQAAGRVHEKRQVSEVSAAYGVLSVLSPRYGSRRPQAAKHHLSLPAEGWGEMHLGGGRARRQGASGPTAGRAAADGNPTARDWRGPHGPVSARPPVGATNCREASACLGWAAKSRDGEILCWE
jgi:hypothetical protein